MQARPADIPVGPSPAAILFPVSENHSIDLDREALETLCATAAAAMRQDAGTTIRVVLREFESYTTGIARLCAGVTLEQKQLILDSLAEERNGFVAEIRHLETGIRYLFSPDLLPLGFPDGLDPGQLATALQAFIRYERDRGYGRPKPALELDLYSEERPRLSARVRLDGDELVTFLKRQGLPPDAKLGHLQLLTLGFSDLGPDLALKRALPAVLSTVAFHAHSLEERGATFDLGHVALRRRVERRPGLEQWPWCRPTRPRLAVIAG